MGYNINQNRGLAKGVVIHNDAGSMDSNGYKNWLQGRDKSLGFAHWYVDRNGAYNFWPEDQPAWHAANDYANEYLLGIEVNQSMSATDAEFLENEQAAFRVAADYLTRKGLTPNRNTVRLHKEFSSTDCPHRSWDLHGQSVDAVKDYFIQEINKYMDGAIVNPGAIIPSTAPKPTGDNKPSSFVPQNGTCKVLVDGLRVRATPSLNGEIVASYQIDKTFQYDGYVDAGGIRWVSYVGETSGLRRYVARRKLDNSHYYCDAY